MILIASLIFTILLITSLIHVGWAFGMVWPAKDEQGLIQTVIGHPDVRKMPSRNLTLAVAGGIAAAGLFGLWGADIVTLPLPGWMKTLTLLGLTGIFVLRGLSSYVTQGPLGKRIEPFVTLDRRYFAPLCLLLGAGFLALFLG